MPEVVIVPDEFKGMLTAESWWRASGTPGSRRRRTVVRAMSPCAPGRLDAQTLSGKLPPEIGREPELPS